MSGSPRELIDDNGIVTRWPKKKAERERVLVHLMALFEPDRLYPESEVNELLRSRHAFEDWALLRRELFEAGLLDRDPRKGLYWVVKRDQGRSQADGT